MSYTVLARRYRSSTFDELIGQQHVAQTLTNAITSNRLAHAFLFTGTRGTGKTSSARILAKCLNCEKSDKPTPKPCGKCNSCLAIAKGEDIDVIEIDAASNTGVDDVREVIENSQYRPARSRFKVYIIDEVHMLSKSAFNALLKTLEEPPEHVKFILATTEAEKVLPTILSRCQRYDFRNIPTREIAAHLKDVCKKEKIKADDDAILLVAKAGAGSMRDALSLLDRLLSAAGDHLTTGTIEQLLGLPRSQLLFDLAQVIGEGKVKETLTQTDQMITSGLAPETLTSSLIDHFRNLLILKTCGKDCDLVEVPGLSIDELVKQAERFDPVVLAQDIVILEELRRQLRSSSAGRALIDATMVRLALAEQFSSVADLLNGTNGASPGATSATPTAKKKYELGVGASHQAQGASANVEETTTFDVRRAVVESFSPRDEGAAPSAPSSNDAAGLSDPSPEETPEPIATVSAAPEEKDELPAVGRVWEGGGATSIFNAFKKSAPRPAAPAPTPPPRNGDNFAPVNVGPVDRNDFGRLMDQFHAAAMQAQHTVAGFLEGARITALDGGTLTLEYPRNLEASARMLDRNGKRESLQQVLKDLLGHDTGIKFEISEHDAELPKTTPSNPAPTAPRSAPRSEPEPAAAPQNFGIPVTEELRVEILTQVPLAKKLAEAFGARIVKVE